MAPVLVVDGLTVRYATPEGSLHALTDVGLVLEPGETLAVVGESGSGKTTLGLAIADLLPPRARVVAGSILLDGHQVVRSDPEAMRRMRGRVVSMVFQDPQAGLNPVEKVGTQVAEVIQLHEGVSARAARGRVVEMLRKVGLSQAEALADAYPYQLSGGMAQRVMLAIAMILGPRLLIADEPTSALDMTIQAQILDQVEQLRREYGTAVLLITHDMGVVAQVADRMAVMYAGSIVEEGDTVAVFRRPAHRYTSALLAALPRLDGAAGRLPAIPGNPPDLVDLEDRCVYLQRCNRALSVCRTDGLPSLAEVEPLHRVRCYHPVPPPAA